jgi:hypothetical protein
MPLFRSSYKPRCAWRCALNAAKAAKAFFPPWRRRSSRLLDKRSLEEMTVDLRAGSAEYWIAKIKLNAIFPYATRIELTREWLEVECAPLLPLPGLDHALAVLITVWGSQAQIPPEFSAGGGLLRVERVRTRHNGREEESLQQTPGQRPSVIGSLHN